MWTLIWCWSKKPSSKQDLLQTEWCTFPKTIFDQIVGLLPSKNTAMVTKMTSSHLTSTAHPVFLVEMSQHLWPNTKLKADNQKRTGMNPSKLKTTPRLSKTSWLTDCTSVSRATKPNHSFCSCCETTNYEYLTTKWITETGTRKRTETRQNTRKLTQNLQNPSDDNTMT